MIPGAWGDSRDQDLQAASWGAGLSSMSVTQTWLTAESQPLGPMGCKGAGPEFGEKMPEARAGPGHSEDDGRTSAHPGAVVLGLTWPQCRTFGNLK